MLCDISNIANFWCIVEKHRIYMTIELNPTQIVEDNPKKYLKFSQNSCWQQNNLMNIQWRIDFLKYFSKKIIKPKKFRKWLSKIEKKQIIDR